MAPLVKLTVISKSGEEAASFLQKSACLSSSSLHSSTKTAVSCVYQLLSTFCKRHFVSDSNGVYKNHKMADSYETLHNLYWILRRCEVHRFVTSEFLYSKPFISS